MNGQVLVNALTAEVGTSLHMSGLPTVRRLDRHRAQRVGTALAGRWPRIGLFIQRGENPLLQNGSKVRFHFAKHQTQARGLDIQDGCRGLKIFS